MSLCSFLWLCDHFTSFHLFEVILSLCNCVFPVVLFYWKLTGRLFVILNVLFINACYHKDYVLRKLK